MDISIVTEIISAFGFPIACTVALFVYVVKQNDSYAKQINDIREAHKQEVMMLKDAINENTKTIGYIYEFIREDLKK